MNYSAEGLIIHYTTHTGMEQMSFQAAPSTFFGEDIMDLAAEAAGDTEVAAIELTELTLLQTSNKTGEKVYFDIKTDEAIKSADLTFANADGVSFNASS